MLTPHYLRSITLLSMTLASCSLFSGDIRESNELGEWVLAKSQTFRYQSLRPEQLETIEGLEQLVRDKEIARNECLARPVIAEFGINNLIYEQSRDCSWEALKSESFFGYVTGNQWTAEEARVRLALARKLWRQTPNPKLVAKKVVWRGIRKDLGKNEEAIKDMESWCLNPSFNSEQQRNWKRLLERIFGSSDSSSDPDTKMYERLNSRICKVAWNVN